MRLKIIKVVLSFVLAAMIISAAYAQPPPTLLWSDPVGTEDIAVSADGQYVVVATHTQVRFYGRSSSTPLWTYSQSMTYWTSVAISADGSYVAASLNYGRPGGGWVVFWADAKSLRGHNPIPPTWESRNLGGPIGERALAISADGNYVAACGTGSNVFYWADATGKSGYSIDTTWDAYLADQVEAITISDDGNHVAAAGVNYVNGGVGVLGYWNNAISLTGHGSAHATWRGEVEDEVFVDVAISDDGDYVVVAGAGKVGPSTVYYWASATTRTSASEPYTWEGGVDVIFTSVDISCDGDSVIAGAEPQFVPYIAGGGVAIAAAPAGRPVGGSVYFWGGAQGLTGKPDPSWTYPTLTAVEDVAINDAGTYMAAVDTSTPADTLYFFNRQGSLLWQDLDISGDKLSISCDGRTLAVGTPAPTTAYLLDTGYSSPCCGEVESVGGAVMPVNVLATLGPWLAVIGSIVCIATVAVVAKKRRP